MKTFVGLTQEYYLAYVDSDGTSTLIESQADLLGLKYVSKDKIIRIRIILSPNEQQQYSSMVKSVVTDSLNDTYSMITDQITNHDSQVEK